VDDLTRQGLDRFVRARNALRSAEQAAEGFVAGKRIASLTIARQQHTEALLALAEWVEERARDQLGRPPAPRRTGHAG
jgi:hypothetical protein